MVIYFQFLKYMCCLYFLMALMAVPAMLLYSSGNPEVKERWSAKL